MIGNIRLRDWQERGYREFEKALDAGKDQFYVVAGVGAGKTIFSTICAKAVYSRKQFSKIVVISPQYRVKKQWAEEFSKVGISLNYKWNKGPLKGYDGISITFDGLVSSLADMLKLVDESTLVIIDEIHHTSTETKDGKNAWGKAAGAALTNVGFRLILSGTPWRYTKEKVLFTPYVKDEYNKYWVAPDFSYSYGEAVADKVNRPVKFEFFGGEVTYAKKGKEYTLPFSDIIGEEEQRQALRVALDLSGKWVDTILHKFYQDIIHAPKKNGVTPAGLVVCKTQNNARQIQEKIRDTYGVLVPMVLSDMKEEGIDPQQVLDNFKLSSDRVLISVGMVSEGVDIPRLTHCLYLSNILSSVFVWQVLGRIVRTLSNRLANFAKMYLPELGILIDIAADIEAGVLGAAEEKEKKQEEQEEQEEKEEETLEGVKEGSVRLPTILALNSTGEHTFTIYKGVMYSPDEIQVIRELNTQGLQDIREEELRRLIDQKLKSTSFIDIPLTSRMQVGEEEALRLAIKASVGKLAASTGTSFRQIHTQANEALAAHYNVPKLTTSEMTIEQLRKKEELLQKQLNRVTA